MSRALYLALSVVLFAAIAAAIGWTLGEFVPLGGERCEPFSDCANDIGGRYAVYAALAGAVGGVLYGRRGGTK